MEHTVAVIIPALDEEEAIAGVIRQIDRNLVDWVVVGDNGSTDGTAMVATQAGALVVREDRRGYGSACLKAIAAVPKAEILVFLDADGGDDPTEITLLLEALFSGDTEVVIGSRVGEKAEAGSLTPIQKFGNKLTCTLVRWLWGVQYADLGPFRTLRRSTYNQLAMQDPDYGWTIEMQVKAAQAGFSVREVPVTYRNRQAGQSKVSGTILGSWRAGKRILGYVFEAKAKEMFSEKKTGFSGTLILFTRYPEPGRTKTRLEPILGPEGAAELHRLMVENALRMATDAIKDLKIVLEIHHTGDESAMRGWLGDDLFYRPQSGGDLGARMLASFKMSLSPAVLMGSDCPDLTAETIGAAFKTLASKEVVLGPAADGGYYLIGMQRPLDEVFRDIPWGHDNVLALTRERLLKSSISWDELETLNDVDRPEDLEQVPDHLMPNRMRR